MENYRNRHWDENIDCNTVIGFDSQIFFSNAMANSNWQFNTQTGILSFLPNVVWQTQFLGTVSESSNTWLWAWANTASNIPGHLLAACLALKAYGEQHGIPELTHPEISLDQINPHTLSLLASGFCEANAYYRCPYEGGALFVLIMEKNFPKCQDPPLQRIATIFPQAISAIDIPDHRLALIGYLDHYRLTHEQDGDKLVVKEDGEPVLTASFDEQSRLTGLEVRMNPVPSDSAEAVEDGEKAEQVESWDQMQLRMMMGW